MGTTSFSENECDDSCSGSDLPLDIEVLYLSGNTACTLQLPFDATVSKLQKEIAEACKLPPHLQRLIHKDQLLINSNEQIAPTLSADMEALDSKLLVTLCQDVIKGLVPMITPELWISSSKDLKVRPQGHSNSSKSPIGIHFGNAYSCVGVWRRNGVDIVSDENGNPQTPSGDVGTILTKIKDSAEWYIDDEVTDAVIAVPDSVDSEKKELMEAAATAAGLSVLSPISEATAAAIAYGVDKQSCDDVRTVFVFDLGATKLNLTLLSVEDAHFETMATISDSNVGGNSFDELLLAACIKDFEKKQKDAPTNADRMSSLRQQCEYAKRTLSDKNKTVIKLESFTDDIDVSYAITKRKFESLIFNDVQQCMTLVDDCLREGGISSEDVDDVIVTGGASRIPLVQEMLKVHFEGKDLLNSMNPDEVVAYGATLHAAQLSNDTQGCCSTFCDLATLSLGIEVAGGFMMPLIDRNTTFPVKKSLVFTTYAHHEKEFRVNIFEGERALVMDNHFLAELSFGITTQGVEDRGGHKLQICFDVDSHGILQVSATELSTGESHCITIVKGPGNFLDGESIKNHLSEAEAHQREDREARRQILERYNLTRTDFTEHEALAAHDEKFKAVPGSNLTELTCS
eukprot:TRINITY_DN5626_c0_g5_i1.p1 TRINITY_DN5626_c0_g5~~TRINITY_DN5626_c0_g5_i1.p1  ORF type:complete len:629 (-),score=104.71 TRINITY_DN5626_c0_g5_i1:222-2108(-)